MRKFKPTLEKLEGRLTMSGGPFAMGQILDVQGLALHEVRGAQTAGSVSFDRGYLPPGVAFSGMHAEASSLTADLPPAEAPPKNYDFSPKTKEGLLDLPYSSGLQQGPINGTLFPVVKSSNGGTLLPQLSEMLDPGSHISVSDVRPEGNLPDDSAQDEPAPVSWLEAAKVRMRHRMQYGRSHGADETSALVHDEGDVSPAGSFGNAGQQPAGIIAILIGLVRSPQSSGGAATVDRDETILIGGVKQAADSMAGQTVFVVDATATVHSLPVGGGSNITLVEVLTA
jgi:hypothetical protein